MHRVGIGYDSHRFLDGRRLMMGGVEIPFERGLSGHSDADVLMHAIIDALLGAAGAGDIGMAFPDDDPKWKDASGRALLREAFGKISPYWKVINVDAVIIAEMPRMSPFIEGMRKNISEDCRMPVCLVSVKSKTNEGMGFIGRGEGIAVLANVLLGRLE